MKCIEMARLMKDANRCVVCKDDDGVQWFGTESALYPAYGWEQMDARRVMEIFDDGWLIDGELLERALPIDKKKPGVKVEMFGMTISVNKKENVVPIRAKEGILFIRDDYFDTVDTNGDGEYVLMEYWTESGLPIIAVQAEDGTKYALFAPWVESKQVMKELRMIANKKQFTKEKAFKIKGAKLEG